MIKHTKPEHESLLANNKTDFTKLLIHERKDSIGTLLLMDRDSCILLEHHLLFSKFSFNTIRINHPNHLFSLFANNEHNPDLIVSSTEMQMVEWVDCLAMIRKCHNTQLNLQTTPVVLYGALPSGHFDTSLPNAHFLVRPPVKLLLEVVFWILNKKPNQQND